MANSSNNNKVKVVELDDEIEGEHVDTTDYYFDKVGEPVPIKLQDSNFDAGSPPSQPLAISEIHGLIVVAHSGGFCVARTKDVIASAKDIKEKGSGPSIQELSVVDVPIGKVHILAISTDNSTLAAAIASDVHFFPLNSLLNKESKPSFSCSLNQSSFVSDLRWRKKAENSFVVLSNSGNLYHGAVDGPLKDLMDDVDAVEWSVKGKFVAVARKKVLCILSSRFKERLRVPLSWKKGFGDSEVNCSIKVDSIKWVRPDCIILGCFQLAADGKVENYLVQVIRSKDGKITDGSVKPVVLSFYDLFLGFIGDILPFGSGPLLFLSYLEQCELAITANRNNTDRHIVLLGWSLADEINEVAVVDIEREKWLPRIELQENDDDNLILGLCVDKTSPNEKVKIQLGIGEHRELSPYCILLCLTLEGKLAMFHVASVGGTSVPPVVTSASSDEEEEEEEEEDTHAVIPVECHLSKPSLGLDKQEFEQVSSGIQFQDVNKKELNTKEDGKINKKSFLKSFDVSKSSVSPVVASPVSLRESNSKNWKGESQSNSESFETDKQHTIPDTKWYQDTDGQQVQPFRQQSSEFYQSNFKASSNTVKDLSKMGSQEIADLESSTSVEGRSSADILGQSNRKNLLNSVGMGKESMGNIGTTSLQSASSHSWTNGKFIYPRDNSERSEFSLSGSIQGNQTENSGISFGAANVSGVKTFHLKDSSSTSTSVNFTGRPAQGRGQRTLTGAQNVESLLSFGSSQMSVQENFAAGKSLNHKLQPSKEDNKFPPLSGMLNSEPNLSKQFGNINGMTKELDALLESIEVEDGFRDACTIYQNSSVEALEQGMSTLSDQCRTWKGIVKERLGKVQHLLDKTVQVSARKIYMEGIVKQASDSRYWDLWNRQKLSSELELKRRHIQQMNQDLTNQLIELERHFNGLELNKFGANAGAHVAQTAFQSRFRPSRRIQSLHSLHSTTSSLSAAAEQLSEYLSKQMAVLSIESQVKQQNIKKELFETVGIPYDASFSSPDATKVSDSPSREKLFSLGSAAAKDRSKRNQLSSMKCSEPETATRRRDPLHQSWTAFEPTRTTVERILLDESQKTSVTRSSYSMDKQQFSPRLPESSAIAHHTALSTFFYPSEYNGMQDTSTKNTLKNPIQFSWANKLPGSSQTFGQKSPTLQRDNATASSSQPSSQFSPILAKGHTRDGFDMATENSFNGSVPVNDAKPMLQSNTNQNQKPSISTMLPTQTVSLLKTSNEMSNSSTKSSPLESRKMPDTSFSSIFNISAVPSLTGKDHLDVPVGNSQPADNELASMFSVPLSAPLIPMINPTTASLSSSSTPTTVQTLSSSIPPSRSFTTFNASTDANQKVSTLTFPSLSAPSSGSFSLQPSKMPVPSCTSATSESPRIELQPPMGKLNVTTDMDARKQAPPLQPVPPNDDVKLRLEPSMTAGHTIEISTGPSSGSQPCFSNMASRAPNVTLNAQPEQPSAARILFPTPPPTSGSGTSEKIESSDVAVTEEDEMEEEAPDTSNTAELTLGSLGGFGIGSTSVPTAPKLNPFGGSFGNAASSPLSSEFNMTVPSGELFRPASFNFQSPQSSQPSQPTNSSAFSGGFSAGMTAQAQSQTGFGQPTQIGSGQQALGSVLGAFGQSRQLGTGLPGIGFATPSGFGGGSSSTGGFSSATSGGGFAGLASGSGGFAGVAPGVVAFSGVASAGGGFAGAASVGGFGPVSSGGFPAAGSVFGAFNSQQGGGGFSAFSTSTGGTGKPSELITRMRK
ncbi:hypothetical protein F2P56_033569 [Juglans regia]|uniref:Nuclear pore complex protein NUP214 n=2 Tax=Juglans regia TaxID=51240 RepID=A0A833TWT1_JUGRE|nr:nuclear pore complex protein NUP214 isoform X2 [Juglans regia]KAF5448069.1 hypothetical protein F2P56_033569 [Juglans regia]